MRCPECDVDLNGNVDHCPLCGSSAEPTPPTIPGHAYQDYPAYAHQKFQRNITLIFLVVSGLLCLGLAVLEFFWTHRIRYAPYVAFGSPAVWALLIRPRVSRSITLGNFLLVAVLALSLLVVWAGRKLPLATLFGSGLAPLSLIAVLILLFHTLFQTKQREQKLLFLLTFLVMSAVEFGITLLESPPALRNLLLSGSALAFSLLNLLLLFLLCRTKLISELKAKLHL